MVKKYLETLTRFYYANLHNLLMKAIGGVPKDLLCEYVEEEGKVIFSINDIHYVTKFQQDKYGQGEFFVTAIADRDSHRIEFEPEKLMHTKTAINKSWYVGNRKIELRGDRLEVRCRLKRMPEEPDEQKNLIYEAFSFTVRELIRTVSSKPVE